MITADTHVIIWNALSPGMLSLKARKVFNRSGKDDGIIICGISLWEIAMLIYKKRLVISMGIHDFIEFNS